MFNLVKYRYLFLLISLVVIVPGTISLLFKGLNVGLDFASGSSIELRPQVQLTNAQVTSLLSPLKLKDVSVTTGNDTTSPGNKTIWMRLNTQIDRNVQTAIENDITGKYPKTNVKFYDLPFSAKTVTLVVADSFATTPQVSDIQTLLAKLPDTSNPAKGPPSATTTPTAATTPAATATPPAAKATATAAARSTPAASGTNPSNIPVSVMDIVQGTTTQTITILTLNTLGTSDVPRVMSTILNQGGPYTQLISNSEVGPSVASETTRNAVLAVLAASAAILLYVWFSFRRVSRPWRYGACAIIALLHDVLVVLGIFSILGWLVGIQVDSLFITALLTVVGFSVHDTIVVFDRIRENMQRRTIETFEQVVNASLVQTMARSLNTSLTVLFTLSALTLFGGVTIRNFTLTLLIGIFSGTYSSIFNASMLLVMWEKREWVFGWFGRDRTPPGKRPARELVGTR